jgi:hypothetical protein
MSDFPLSPIAQSSKQKNQKEETSELNDTIDQMDLTDIYRIFYPIATEYPFFSEAQGNFSKIDHVLGHKSSLNKYKKIEKTSCILSHHNEINLEINSNGNYRKYANTGDQTIHFRMISVSMKK